MLKFPKNHSSGDFRFPPVNLCPNYVARAYNTGITAPANGTLVSPQNKYPIQKVQCLCLKTIVAFFFFFFIIPITSESVASTLKISFCSNKVL